MSRMYGGDTRGGQASLPPGMSAKLDSLLRKAFEANRLREGLYALPEAEQARRWRRVRKLTQECEQEYLPFRRHPFSEQRWRLAG